MENESKHSLPFNRNFKAMIVNESIGRTGTAAFGIAIVWIALTLTKSPIIAGFSDSMVSLPLFLSFIFGAYIDRLHSRKILSIIASLVRTIAIGILFIPIFDSSILARILALFSVSVLLGMTSDILGSIRSAWTKQFLSEDQYQNGMSLSESLASLAQATGYAISGLMLVLGLNIAIYFLVIIFAVSTIPLAVIKERKVKVENIEESFMETIVAGLKYIQNSRALKGILVLMMVINLAFGSVSILFAYLVDDTFQLPAIYYGFLLMALTVGIIIGAVSGSKVHGRIGTYNLFMIISTGIALAIMGILKNIYPDFAVVTLIGFMIGIVNVISTTGLLKIVDQTMMARVNGAFSTFALGITFLSGGIGGLLIEIAGIKFSLFLIGGIVAAMGIISISFREYYNLRV